MENNANGQDGQRKLSDTEIRANDEMRLRENMNITPDTTLPYPDPAVINPAELATFPRRSEITDAEEIENESESHLVNRRTPVREGRNITRTDNNPNNEGFL